MNRTWRDIEIRVNRENFIPVMLPVVANICLLFYSIGILPLVLTIKYSFLLGFVVWLVSCALIAGLLYALDGSNVFTCWYRFFGTEVYHNEPFYYPSFNENEITRYKEREEWFKGLIPFTYRCYMGGRVIFLFKQDAMMYKLIWMNNR